MNTTMRDTEQATEEESAQPVRFDASKYLTKIDTSQGKKDYLPLQGRLLWLTGEVSEYTIETEPLLLDLDRVVEVERMVWSDEAHRKVPVKKSAQGVAIYHAVLSIFQDGQLVKRVPGDKMETAVDFADFVEKAQSGAISRCLMFAGFGTAFAIELDEGERISDTPIVARPKADNANGQQIGASAPATDQQKRDIARIRAALKMAPEQRELTYAQAKDEIRELTSEYNQQRKAKAS